MGAPLAWVWGVRGRGLSHPRPLVRSGVRPGPTTQWLWVREVRAWGPVTNPTARALACCGGGMRVPGGGASRLGVGQPGTGALPPPTSRPFGLAAGAHYPLAVAAGDAGMGTHHQPHSTRPCALWGRHVGAPGGRLLPGCGGPGTGALPSPTSRTLGLASGAHYPLAVGAGGAGMGTHHQPHSTRPCALWGRHEGARGGRLSPGCGASWDGRSPTPDLSSVRACGRGPLPTGYGCGGCGHGDPSPTPQHAPLRAVGAACGCPRGAPLAWVWGVRGRALSHPRPLVRSGLRPGPTTHWLWVRGLRAWGPVSNPTAHALGCCGGGMRVPRGGASCMGVGRPGSGALPPPTSRPFGRAAGAHYPLAVGSGGAGVGTRHQPHSTRPRALWGRHVGA